MDCCYMKVAISGGSTVVSLMLLCHVNYFYSVTNHNKIMCHEYCEYFRTKLLITLWSGKPSHDNTT